MDRDEARQRGCSFLTGQAKGRRGRAVHPEELRLAAEGECRLTGSPLYYVFNSEGNGFVVVSGDDRLPAVLGFSLHGRWDAAHVPASLCWWLETYEGQAALALRRGVKLEAIAADETLEVEPLVTCHWGQFAPFNGFCPTGYNGEPCAAGCVAVAMAQMMYYHRWPLRGEGYKSYDCYVDGNPEAMMPQEADFGQTEYTWRWMKDDYDEEDAPTDVAVQAVALLMYHLGVATQMQYSVYASGALIDDAIEALETYFRYDVERFDGSVGEMAALTLDDLRQRQPVIMAGRSEDRRFNHVFVCDGYRSDGYFHFNWGWQGEHDGYFLMTRLEPDDIREYNHYQILLHGIRPRRSETDVTDGMERIVETGRETKSVFSMSGIRLRTPAHGISIVHDANGSRKYWTR